MCVWKVRVNWDFNKNVSLFCTTHADLYVNICMCILSYLANTDFGYNYRVLVEQIARLYLKLEDFLNSKFLDEWAKS